jgi:hypothetical protein
MGKINYSKWNSLGFLEDLCEKHGTKLANGYECLSIRLIDDNKLVNRKFNENVDVIAFPTLRKIYNFDSTIDLNKSFISKFLNKLLEFTNSDDFKSSCSCETPCSISKNTEANLLNKFANDYDSQ